MFQRLTLSRQKQKQEFDVELLKRGENLMERIGNHAASEKLTKLAVDSVSIEGWRPLPKQWAEKKNLSQQATLFVN